jgi:Domain of unknown function (DUF4394)
MKNMNKKTSITVVLITFTVLTVLLAVAPIKQSVSNAQTVGIIPGGLPNRNIFALTSDNAIYVLVPGATQYRRVGRVSTAGGNLIGIDFRPADGRLYGLTDQGTIFQIGISTTAVGAATLISTINPRFTGGFGMLFDFNPVANAARVAGSNDQNIAVVNAATGGNLNQTVPQTRFTYAAGDPFAGQDPEIVGGAYDNNRNGAATTTFYVIDHDKDTLATIATRVNGSSATGTGVLKTIGRFIDYSGNRLNMSPTSDFDIYTDATGRNFLVGQTTRLLFTINLAAVNSNLPVGTTQNVLVQRGAAGIQLPNNSIQPLSGGVFDIAVQ